MGTLHINDKMIEMGVGAFDRYMLGLICGHASAIYHYGMNRPTGMSVVPGAIVACIGRGINSEREIISAVSRTSRCRRNAVEYVLQALTGVDPRQHLWCFDGLSYSFPPKMAGTPTPPIKVTF